MEYNTEEIQMKFLMAINESEPYSMEDFNSEFGHLSEIENALNNADISNFTFSIKVNYKNESTNEDPTYATDGASGFDLRANEDNVINPTEFKMISTGLFFDLPFGYELQVRSRSGLAAKHGVAVLNGIGTVDNDYKGEVKVILINHGKEPFVITKGDRIAQGVISQALTKQIIALNKVETISNNTIRGTNGFVSTGLR